jgi:copper resistance protein B
MKVNTVSARKLLRLLNPVPWSAVLLPLAAVAQSGSPHDMAAMPGMQMESPKAASPRVEPPPRMDHGAMPGMRHDMPGMEQAARDTSAPTQEQPAMDHSSMPGMEHGQMPAVPEMPAMAAEPSTEIAPMEGMDTDSMMKSMQGGPPPADARDPDAYADGMMNGPMPGMNMADDASHARVLIDRVEQFHSGDGNGQAIDAQAWFGGDIDKLWLKLDGERVGGKLGATRTEALWNRAIATYWSVQAGIRHDFGGGPGRTWAALGLQGLSPYWFDVQGTAYAGQHGRTALRFETEYDLLLTQRLVLQPDVKINLYGRNDPEREIGSGLSDIDAGLRLRYELSRKFAPYVGVTWNRKFANTARYAREAGKPVQETRIVAGLRLWF